MADMFLKLTDIDGESLDGEHQDEIELTDWHWTTANTAPLGMSKREATSMTVVKDVVLRKGCDKASVNLVRYCAIGKHIPRGRIACRKRGGDEHVEYLTIELTDVKISEVTWNWEGPEKGLTENVKIDFGVFKVKYTVQNETGGGGATLDFGFNITESREM